LEESAAGRILEMMSRVLASLDGIRRSIDEIGEAVDALASTIYVSCLLERYGKGKVVRSGLPAAVSFIIETEKEIFVVKAKVVSSYEDAMKVRDVAEKLFPPGSTEKSVVPTLVTSKYKSHDVPADVNVIIC